MYDTWFCFSPAKNNCSDAIACFNKGLPSFSAASAEYDMYNWNCKMLELANVNLKRSEESHTFAGIPWKFGPKIFLEPSFAITFQELKQRFSCKTDISARSTIVLGGDVLSEKQEFLGVDGTLIARSKLNFFDHYSTELIEFKPVEQNDAEIFQIRGYKPKHV